MEEFEFSHLMGYLNTKNIPGITTTAKENQRYRAVLAHALRRMAAAGSTPVLTNGLTLRILQEDRLPTLSEQRDNLLRWFGNVEVGPIHSIGYHGLGARIGCVSRGTFQILLESALGEGFLRGNLTGDDGGEFKLAAQRLGSRLKQKGRLGGGPSDA